MFAKAGTALEMGSDLVEFRVDLLREPESALQAVDGLSRFARRSVVTVRRMDEGGGYAGSESKRLDLISQLAQLGPAFLDVELSTTVENPGWLSSIGIPKGSMLIVSWHDFNGTPAFKLLERRREESETRGDVAKVVTLARRRQDNLRVLKLYEQRGHGPLIAFCMGQAGRASRLAAMRLGSPVTYAALPNEAVAPGQITLGTLLRLRKVLEVEE